MPSNRAAVPAATMRSSASGSVTAALTTPDRIDVADRVVGAEHDPVRADAAKQHLERE